MLPVRLAVEWAGRGDDDTQGEAWCTVWVRYDYAMTDWARETGTVKYMVSQRATHCTLSCSVYVSRLSERLSVSIRLHTL